MACRLLRGSFDADRDLSSRRARPARAQIVAHTTPAQFRALATFYGARRDLLVHNLISFVDESAYVRGFDADALAELRDLYRALQMSADFIVRRRSGWVCPNVAAWPLL